MIGFNLGPVGRAVQGLGGSAAPWAFVGVGAVTSSTSPTQTLVLPLHSPAQAGDFIVVQLSTAGGFGAPAGTAVDSGAQLSRYITATGGETSITFTLASAVTATGVAATFRPTSPGVRAASSSVTGNPAVVTSLAVSNLPSLITIGGNHNAANAAIWTESLPADFVVLASVPGNVGGTVRALYLAYKVQAAGSVTGNLSLSASPNGVRTTVGVFRLT